MTIVIVGFLGLALFCCISMFFLFVFFLLVGLFDIIMFPLTHELLEFIVFMLSSVGIGTSKMDLNPDNYNNR